MTSLLAAKFIYLNAHIFCVNSFFCHRPYLYVCGFSRFHCRNHCHRMPKEVTILFALIKIAYMLCIVVLYYCERIYNFLCIRVLRSKKIIFICISICMKCTMITAEPSLFTIWPWLWCWGVELNVVVSLGVCACVCVCRSVLSPSPWIKMFAIVLILCSYIMYTVLLVDLVLNETKIERHYLLLWVCVVRVELSQTHIYKSRPRMKKMAIHNELCVSKFIFVLEKFPFSFEERPKNWM